LAQKIQVGPCIPVKIQLQRAGGGPTWRLSHFVQPAEDHVLLELRDRQVRPGLAMGGEVISTRPRIFCMGIPNGMYRVAHKMTLPPMATRAASTITPRSPNAGVSST
jgi:hypothetical protein